MRTCLAWKERGMVGAKQIKVVYSWKWYVPTEERQNSFAVDRVEISSPPPILSECFCHGHIFPRPSLFSEAYASGCSSWASSLPINTLKEAPGMGWGRITLALEECMILISFLRVCTLLRRSVALWGSFNSQALKAATWKYCHLGLQKGWMGPQKCCL